MDLVRLNWWHPTVRPDKSNDFFWDSLIHSEDLTKLTNSKLKSDIFFIRNHLTEYVEIEQLNLVIRVKENSLTKIKFEGFYLNDSVETISNVARQNSYIKGTINQIIFHHKDKVLNYYLLDSNNKKISKRYTALDLRKIEPNASS